MAGQTPLVSTDWLAEHLHDEDVAVLEVANTRDLSDTGHIPGAHAVFWKDRGSVFRGCNAAFAEQAGLDPAQIVGKTDLELGRTEEQADFYRECDQQVIQSGEPLLGLEHLCLQLAPVLVRRRLAELHARGLELALELRRSLAQRTLQSLGLLLDAGTDVGVAPDALGDLVQVEDRDRWRGAGHRGELIAAGEREHERRRGQAPAQRQV